MEKYWNKEIECMPREEMKKLQDQRLVAQVKHVYENVKYYRDLMVEKGVKPEDIKGTDDLQPLGTGIATGIVFTIKIDVLLNVLEN